MKRTEYWMRRNGPVKISRMVTTTAKRLRNKAQGCRAATTLGPLEWKCRNPNGVANQRMFTQGSRRAATLGFVTQPLRGLIDSL